MCKLSACQGSNKTTSPPFSAAEGSDLKLSGGRCCNIDARDDAAFAVATALVQSSCEATNQTTHNECEDRPIPAPLGGTLRTMEGLYKHTRIDGRQTQDCLSVCESCRRRTLLSVPGASIVNSWRNSSSLLDVRHNAQCTVHSTPRQSVCAGELASAGQHRLPSQSTQIAANTDPLTPAAVSPHLNSVRSSRRGFPGDWLSLPRIVSNSTPAASAWAATAHKRGGRGVSPPGVRDATQTGGI